MKTTAETECCPKFDPVHWDDTVLEWDNKRFIKDSVFTFMYMPINFGGAMRRLTAQTERAGATVPQWLCLSEHTSMWKMDLYLAVDKDVPLSETVVMKGVFYCKVYEGSFSDTGKWIKDFNAVLADKGMKSSRQFAWYTTCPKCAKKYGKNYVALIAKLE